MTDTTLNDLMRREGWTRRDVARITRRSPKAVDHWRSGRRRVPDYAEELLLREAAKRAA